MAGKRGRPFIFPTDIEAFQVIKNLEELKGKMDLYQNAYF